MVLLPEDLRKTLQLQLPLKTKMKDSEARGCEHDKLRANVYQTYYRTGINVIVFKDTTQIGKKH